MTIETERARLQEILHRIETMPYDLEHTLIPCDDLRLLARSLQRFRRDDVADLRSLADRITALLPGRPL
jgi:hypothetical protein